MGAVFGHAREITARGLFRTRTHCTRAGVQLANFQKSRTCTPSTRAHTFRTRRCRALDGGVKEQKITGQADPDWLESLERAILSLIAAA